MKIAARDIMSNVVGQSDILVEVSGEYKQKLMSTLVEIMQDIHDVCVKYKIKYALMGGTALGAIRHKGFIPWDDDLDISMLREDFEAFKQVFDKELGDKYIFDAPNIKGRESKCTFGKVHKKGTDLWEVQDACNPFPFPRCIYVDVFVYDNVSDYALIRRFDAIISDFMKGVATSMIYWKYNSEILECYFGSTRNAKRYYKMRKMLGLIQYIIPHKIWVNMFDRFVSRHKNPSSKITAPTGRKYYIGEIIDRDWWEPMQLVEFEGHQFYTINKVNDYLRHLYGENYMQLPPENKRERHFCVKLDFGDGMKLG